MKWYTYYKEGFLIQIIFYSLLWLIDDYVGLLLCMIMAAICTALLVFSLMLELVEKSKVPKSFFKWLLLSAIAPAITAIGFSILYEGKFDWHTLF